LTVKLGSVMSESPCLNYMHGNWRLLSGQVQNIECVVVLLSK